MRSAAKVFPDERTKGRKVGISNLLISNRKTRAGALSGRALARLLEMTALGTSASPLLRALAGFRRAFFSEP